MADGLVLDASAMVDLLIASPQAIPVRDRIRGRVIHVPAHFDAEVLSALGRLERASQLTARETEERVASLAESTFERHLCAPLVLGAWTRRANMRLVDALYVELGSKLGLPVVSTDARLAATDSTVELVEAR
jgi:predicted nucleic acid-binding protein